MSLLQPGDNRVSRSATGQTDGHGPEHLKSHAGCQTCAAMRAAKRGRAKTRCARDSGYRLARAYRTLFRRDLRLGHRCHVFCWSPHVGCACAPIIMNECIGKPPHRYTSPNRRATHALHPCSATATPSTPTSASKPESTTVNPLPGRWSIHQASAPKPAVSSTEAKNKVGRFHLA